MNKVSLKEARRRLGDLVDEATHGATVVITRRGRDVARLVPEETRPLKGLPDLTKFRASLRSEGKGLSAEVSLMRREARF